MMLTSVGNEIKMLLSLKARYSIAFAAVENAGLCMSHYSTLAAFGHH